MEERAEFHGFPKMTRRYFLKASAATLAIVAATEKLLDGPKVLEALGSGGGQPTGEDVWIPTTCLACAAHNKCSLLAHRVNGVLVKIEGNPASPVNQGRNCAKSNAAIMTLYNPYRVKFPVKRTNPQKGPGVDPKWAEITWEEALATVTEKLKKVKEEDPRQFAFIIGHGGNQDVEVVRPFAAAFGTPNVIYGGTAAACGGGSSPFNDWINGEGHARADMLYCKYFINLGANSQLGAKGHSDEIQAFVEAHERGLKVVNVSPIQSPSTVKSDEWIPIRPGTATLFVMAMVNVLLHELNVYDSQFLKRRTNGPFLISEDGFYLRAEGPLVEDPVRKEKLGKPLVWDPVEGKAKTFDDPTLKDVALEGTYTVKGVTCRPAFQVLKDHARQYTPEKAAEMTTIPAATIRRLAREWAENAQIGSTITIDGQTFPYRPVAIIAEQGAKCHIDNYMVMMAAKLLSLIVGAVDCPGSAKAATAPTMTVNPADGVRQCPLSYTPIKYPPERLSLQDLNPLGGFPALAYLTMKDPKAYGIPYEVKVLGIFGGNPQALLADPDLVAEAFRRVPFTFAISYTFDEPTEQADIVLPENSWLERYGLSPVMPHTSYTEAFKAKGTAGTSLRQPVVKTVYNTRPGNEILMDLAERLGILYGKGGVNERLSASLGLKGSFALDPFKKYTWEEITDLRLKASYGQDRGLDWLKKHGIIMKPAYPVKQYYGATKYPDLRVPIYFEEFVVFRRWLAAELAAKGIKLKPSNEFVLASYQPLPVWRPHPEHLAPADFDLYCINYKNMQQHYGTNTDNAWLMEWTANYDPYSMRIWMNTDTARKKGLKNGDTVWVESFTGGKVQGQVKTSECVHPEVVAIGACFGNRSANIFPMARLGPHFNALNRLSEEYLDPLTFNIDRDTRIRISKA